MVTIYEDVHRSHRNKNICSATIQIKLVPRSDSRVLAREDVPMACLAVWHDWRPSAAKQSAGSHHMAKRNFFGLIVRGIVASCRVRAEPVDRDARPRLIQHRGPRNILFITWQRCKVNFSKVL